MNYSDPLLAYIKTLTTEQVETLMNHLPELLSLSAEQEEPYPLEQSVQTAKESYVPR